MSVRAFAGREVAEIYCAAMLSGWRDRCHLARRARVQKLSLLSGPRSAGILCGPCGEQQLLSLSEESHWCILHRLVIGAQLALPERTSTH